MPPNPLPDPVSEALSTSQRHLALTRGGASRYPAAVAPFAGIADLSAGSLADLRELLAPREAVFVVASDAAPLPHVPGLAACGVVACLQLVFPPDAPLPQQPPPARAIDSLDCANASAMLELINLAYPGYFRAETCRMGRYFGIRDSHGTLIAMGGERLIAHPWREISGLCSHPAHAGEGLGTAVLLHLLALHRAEGSRSWLWVTESNRKALALYTRLGFQTVGCSPLHRLQRTTP